MTDNKDENAKNPSWKVPTDLPSVKPEDYDASIDSGRGSAGQKKPQLPPHKEEIGGASSSQ